MVFLLSEALALGQGDYEAAGGRGGAGSVSHSA